MSRWGIKTTLTVMGIGMLIATSALEVEAGRFGGGRGSFGRGGGRSFGRGNFGNRGGIGRNFGRANRGPSNFGKQGTIGKRIGNRIGNWNGRGGIGNGIAQKGKSGGHGKGWGFGKGRHHHHHHFGRFGFFGRRYGHGHGFGFGFAYISGGVGFSNPYCEAPIGGYDYTVPVEAPDSSVEQSPAGMQAFEAALAAFKQGDFQSAQKSAAIAAKEMPGDVNVHQFHSLTLFALGDYRNSAAVAYASLTVSSGWNWATLRGLYSDAAVYTAQLRALENATQASPDAAELRFLLGYHYLMLGHKADANKQLSRTVELQPNNDLARQLLKLTEKSSTEGYSADKDSTEEYSKRAPETVDSPSLGGLGALANAGSGNSESELVEAEQNPEQPVPAMASLAGTWTARPQAGVEITLVINSDNSFVWKVAVEGETDEFSGKVTLEGNKITFVAEGVDENLEGTLDVNGPTSFRLKLAGGDDAPELSFTR